MTRAPFQVLVLPFKKTDEEVLYAVLARSDNSKWQGISGGGEDNETPIQAAQRESLEEAGIPITSRFIKLQATSSIPVSCFRDSYLWSNDLFVIPEYSFGIDASGITISLSAEHSSIKWQNYESTLQALSYDSNKTALWELNKRLLGRSPHDL